MVDGDYQTFWSAELGAGLVDPLLLPDPNRRLFFDLGAWYWVDRALLVFDPNRSAFWNYVISLSDGSRSPDGSLVYTPLIARGATSSEERENSRLTFQDNVFPLTRARHFKLDYRLVEHDIQSVVKEIQLYGHGFLPRVSLESELIELGEHPRVLSAIHWEADTPSGTQVQIRTRTGNQLRKEVHYFTSTGLEVTEEKYRKLLSFQRGDSTLAVIPGEGWSNWSQFYPASGAAITSPSPRRYAMIQATLSSDDPEQAAALRRLHIELDTPLVSQIVGEIAPQRTEQQGRRETFTLFLRPVFQAGDRGFDQVLIALPPGPEVEVVEFALGEESELAGGGGRRYRPDELLRIQIGPDSLWVRLPELVRQTQDLMALRFAGVLYLASNAFVVSVGLGEGEERVWQRVDAGEATALEEGRDMTVFTPFDEEVLGEVEAAPNPFTPNGDGLNEVVELVFPVFKVQGAKTLVLEVYRLDGVLVQRREESVVHAAGLQRVVWDGRGRDGKLLPPGLYLCRVGLEVDAEGVQPMVAKLVASVY